MFKKLDIHKYITGYAKVDQFNLRKYFDVCIYIIYEWTDKRNDYI